MKDVRDVFGIVDENGNRQFRTAFVEIGMAAVHFGMCVLIVGELVYGAVFYLLTTYFLKRRLNLE